MSKLTVLEQESRQFFVPILTHDVQDGHTVFVLPSAHGPLATSSHHGSSSAGK